MNPALIAILGPSGSGKSALALELAQRLDAQIVSLDSLSIYKEINIASAKPSLQDLQCVKHYGINVLEIHEKNNAPLFKQELEKAIATTPKKTLLIVGGSSFYLKAILEGLSPMPHLSPEQRLAIQEKITALNDPHAFLTQIDPAYAQMLKPQDTYRTTKALEIYFATKLPPTLYFQKRPKIPFEHPIKLYALQISKDQLCQNIAQRTTQMLKCGIVEEIRALVVKYGSDHQPFRAIGPKECLQHLQGKLNLKELHEAIYTHTCQLAKRQMTFNRTQFKEMSLVEPHKLLAELTP
ncbi:tRNA delta(2)-isopentenylpyrophosphate transferase [Helicobacter bizzozeronii CCUG 35545]|nr:tRNA delta(2)-isopentenylpyrophosphate transferase [Helicobacter bizzozeronii CCUG 35545]